MASVAFFASDVFCIIVVSAVPRVKSLSNSIPLLYGIIGCVTLSEFVVFWNSTYLLFMSYKLEPNSEVIAK